MKRVAIILLKTKKVQFMKYVWVQTDRTWENYPKSKSWKSKMYLFILEFLVYSATENDMKCKMFEMLGTQTEQFLWNVSFALNQNNILKFPKMSAELICFFF